MGRDAQVAVRMPKDMRDRLQRLAAAMKSDPQIRCYVTTPNISTAVRIALAAGLPSIEQMFGVCPDGQAK